MLKGTFPIGKFKPLETPFYYYDMELLQKTLDTIKAETGKFGCFHVHYADKANANPRILSLIASNGLGADCVSGGEIQQHWMQAFLLIKLFLQEWAKLIGKSI